MPLPAGVGIAVLGINPSNTINGTLDVNGNSIPITNLNNAATGEPTTFTVGTGGIITNSGGPVTFSNIINQAEGATIVLCRKRQ